jgi:3',5'-cyclic AMP phosphodiesterase CpdA
MLIAQVSDVHIGGGRDREERLRAAIEEINTAAPDLVAVTGELTNEGYPDQYPLATEVLYALACPLIVRVPGQPRRPLLSLFTRAKRRASPDDRSRRRPTGLSSFRTLRPDHRDHLPRPRFATSLWRAHTRSRSRELLAVRPAQRRKLVLLPRRGLPAAARPARTT